MAIKEILDILGENPTESVYSEGKDFFLGTAVRLPRRCCSTYSPQTEQATSRSGSSSAPRTNAAMATMMPTKMLVLFRMALSDFIVDYRPFTKQKGLHQVSVLNT